MATKSSKGAAPLQGSEHGGLRQRKLRKYLQIAYGEEQCFPGNFRNQAPSLGNRSGLALGISKAKYFCFVPIPKANAMSDNNETAGIPREKRIGLSRREFINQMALGAGAVSVLSEFDLPVLADNRQIARAEAGDHFRKVSLRINDVVHSLEVNTRVTLLDALREKLGLTGSKKGCDHGQCGACTVLVDGRRINSCLTLAVMCQDAEITTVEGLTKGQQLHPVQTAFIKHDAFQCGYCTPGQICSAVGLLKERHAHTPEQVSELMSGNICRCGAYRNIVGAICEAGAIS